MKCVLVATILALVLTTANGAAPSPDAPTVEIHKLQNDFLTVLRKRDTAKFLSYIGTHGVAFGIDAPFQSRKEVANEFRTKNGAYCFLFDSSCLTRKWNAPTRHAGRAGRFCSVYELLTVTKDDKVDTTIDSYQGKPQAYLWITSGSILRQRQRTPSSSSLRG